MIRYNIYSFMAEFIRLYESKEKKVGLDHYKRVMGKSKTINNDMIVKSIDHHKRKGSN